MLEYERHDGPACSGMSPDAQGCPLLRYCWIGASQHSPEITAVL